MAISKKVKIRLNDEWYEFAPLSKDDFTWDKVASITIEVNRTNLPKDIKIILKELYKEDNQ